LAERIDPQIVSRIRVMAAQLLADQNFHEEVRRDAWEKMTRQEHKEMLEETPKELREHICDEILMQPPQKWEELPQQLRERLRHVLEVDPGEFVEIEDTGIGLQMPKVSYEYLDDLWVLENMRDELHESVEAELDREVLYIFTPGTTWISALPKSRPRGKSSAVSNVTSLGNSIESSPPHCLAIAHRFWCLDEHRSIFCIWLNDQLGHPAWPLSTCWDGDLITHTKRLSYVPARNLRYARLPKLAHRVLCAEPGRAAIYSLRDSRPRRDPFSIRLLAVDNPRGVAQRISACSCSH
jgi:hypothetical protein